MCDNSVFACILTGGSIQRIVAFGTPYLFEWHPYCGPVDLNEDYSEKKEQPSAESPFWEAVTYWDQQGRRMNGEWCIWDIAPPPREKLKHLGGKHWLIVGYDDVAPSPGW